MSETTVSSETTSPSLAPAEYDGGSWRYALAAYQERECENICGAAPCEATSWGRMLRTRRNLAEAAPSNGLHI